MSMLNQVNNNNNNGYFKCYLSGEHIAPAIKIKNNKIKIHLATKIRVASVVDQSMNEMINDQLKNQHNGTCCITLIMWNVDTWEMQRMIKGATRRFPIDVKCSKCKVCHEDIEDHKEN